MSGLWDMVSDMAVTAAKIDTSRKWTIVTTKFVTNITKKMKKLNCYKFCHQHGITSK